MIQKALLGGYFTFECFGADGKLKWTEGPIHNLVTTEGINHDLTILLKNGTVIDPWYVVIFESNTTPLAAHTYAVPGYTESTAYTEGTRPEFVDGAIAAGAINNSASKAVFSINATKTIYGGALVGGGAAASTKADTAGGGKLLCSVLLGASRAVISGDVLNVQYTFTLADDGV